VSAPADSEASGPEAIKRPYLMTIPSSLKRIVESKRSGSRCVFVRRRLPPRLRLAVRLIKAFQRVRDPKRRQEIIAFVERVAAEST
jgi:hypothetical protein